ncbi:MAG: hypothetical protein DCC67_15900 [Planctomycetota bacterium]|nr:MAG: hypothetical protein DCC67_15900 [Planctomycetota bacterium]
MAYMTAPAETPAATNAPSDRRLLNAGLGVTTLLAAWLLFQVQPMAGKRILPWFGGGSAVWTTAMLFFQGMLLVGYGYAHVVSTYLPPRRQARLHVLLLGLAAALLVVAPAAPGEAWKPASSDFPTVRIIAILAASVGLPYLMLASTAPLVQTWFARANPGRSPYRLYALSNVGSLAALVCYPLVIEPNMGLSEQSVAWSLLFALFAACCGACGVASHRLVVGPPAAGAPSRRNSHAAPTRRGRSPYWLWLLLPACASSLMLSVTTHLSSDVAPMPLLWIGPMVAYLLSFIIAFDSDRWYRRWWWLPAAAVASLLAAFNWRDAGTRDIDQQILIQLALVLCMATVCHGELARRRPPAARLTAFYLCVAAGGALGGFFNSVVAPLAFSDYYELPLGLVASWLIVIALLLTDRRSPLRRGGHGLAFWGRLALIFAAVGLLALMVAVVARDPAGIVVADRNFYGALKVRAVNIDGTNETYFNLVHGRIAHGAQFRSISNRRVPMYYYHPESGVGQTLANRVAAGGAATPQRVGVVGLGAGTLAAYAEQGDYYRFYEINPAVIRIANRHFTYLRDARGRGAKIDVAEGDARLSLEREAPQHFDLLAFDAFNSDSIPSHLLTLEAVNLYVRHLRQPDGLLAVHVSNRHLALDAVVQAIAERAGLDAALVKTSATAPGTFACTWVLLHRRPGYFAERKLGVPLAQATAGRIPVLWTDDYSNVFSILKDDGGEDAMAAE